jgi:iron complex outermembrane recepter protein
MLAIGRSSTFTSRQHVSVKRFGTLLTLPLLAGMLASVSGAAYAQATPSADKSSSEGAEPFAADIIVTATRQDQSLSKVPLSVVAITPRDMDARGVRNIDDISRLSPGLSLTPYGGGNDVSGTATVVSIRGVSSNVGSATTGIYIDDTPIQARSLGNATSNAYPQLFDLERVEVLRGPQGTLFGAGAEGGAVRFITPKPSLDNLSIYARGELATTEGGAPTYEAGVAVGTPIVQDKLGVRVSAWFRREGGYIDRTNDAGTQILDKDSNSLSSYVIRGALKWQASDQLSATFSVTHQQQDLDDIGSFYSTISNPNAGKFQASRVFASNFKDRFTIPSLDLRYEGDAVDVIATSSYYRRKYNRYVDYTKFISSVVFGTPYLFLPGEFEAATLIDRQSTWSNEVRVQSKSGGRLNWVVGGFYGRSKQSFFQENDDPFINTLFARFGIPPLPLLPGNHALRTSAEAIDKQIAGFGQIEYEVADGLKIQAGVRAAKFDLKTSRASEGPIAGPGPASFSDTTSESPITPKFGISYQAGGDTLIYASASKGYRVGGGNSPQIAFCNSTLAQLGLTSTPEKYRSDSLWAYEGGVKSKLAGGRLSVAASAFDIRWKNIQQLAVLAQCNGSFIVNVGAARVTGFDLAADFRASDKLNVGGSIAYADARLTKDFAGPPVAGQPTFFARKGNKVGGAPLSFTLYGEFSQPVSDKSRLYARADYQHAGQGADLDLTLFGTDPLSRRSESYDQVALRLGLRTDRFDLSAFVNNLLDEAPVLSSVRTRAVPSDDLFTNTTIRPRTFGLTGTFRY